MKIKNYELLALSQKFNIIDSLEYENISLSMQFWNKLENNKRKVMPHIETYNKLVKKVLDEYGLTYDDNGRVNVNGLEVEKQQEFELKLNELLNIDNEIEIEIYDMSNLDIDVPNKFYKAISFMTKEN